MDDKKLKANLNKALSALKVLDKQRWFSRPVSDTEALGYSSFIHRPMSFEVIARNIASGEIRRVVQLQRDVLLMLLNAQFFNPPGHAVWKEAQVLLKAVPELFEKHLVIEAHLLSEACAPHPIAPTGTVRNPRAMRSRKYWHHAPPGCLLQFHRVVLLTTSVHSTCPPGFVHSYRF